MDRWTHLTVGDLCEDGLAELQTGPFGSQLHAHEYVAEGVPVVPTEAIRDRKIDHSVLPRVLAEKANQLSRHRLRAGDILFARRGVQATGHSAFVREHEEGFLCGTGAIRLRLLPQNNKVDATFLSHVFANQASIDWFKFHAIGATMPNLNEGIIRSFRFACPPLSEQHAIASILGALDDKIELNRRMNETLEAIARAIFQDWFVAFGPTRAKMDGRPPYLAPDLWALFPDRLDDEGKPEGWATCPLLSVAALGRETVSPASAPDELFDHYSIPAFDAGQTPNREPGASILSNKALVPVGAVLLSKLNPEIPRVWLVDADPTVRSICSTEFLVLSPVVESNRAFLYSVVSGPGFRHRLEAQVTGTSKSHQRVKPQSVLEAEIIMPPPSVIAAFRHVAVPLLDCILANRRESRTLAATRDLLLPRLMSGELRVTDAERLVETAA